VLIQKTRGTGLFFFDFLMNRFSFRRVAVSSAKRIMMRNREEIALIK